MHNDDWLKKAPSWIEAAAALKARHQSFVLVTVLNVVGSAPRETGTKMLVCAEGIKDSIGGGHLEYSAIAKAQELLQDTSQDGLVQHIEDYPLSARLGQCCGGRVTLLFESFMTANKPVFIFGAGHVGRALVTILAQLPVNITWVDTRASEFPEHIPMNVNKIISVVPHEDVADIPKGAYVLVMTHNHTMDFDIVRKALARDDVAYLGVIGSKSKANRFRKRLEHRGFSDEKIAFLRCPIGLADIPGKKPMEVAVSVAGEIIQLYHQKLASDEVNQTDSLVLESEQ